MTRSVLVTGASKGIGRGIARVFASKGDNLTVLARSGSVADQVAAELENDFGPKAPYINFSLCEMHRRRRSK